MKREKTLLKQQISNKGVADFKLALKVHMGGEIKMTKEKIKKENQHQTVGEALSKLDKLFDDELNPKVPRNEYIFETMKQIKCYEEPEEADEYFKIKARPECNVPRDLCSYVTLQNEMGAYLACSLAKTGDTNII